MIRFILRILDRIFNLLKILFLDGTEKNRAMET
jgi:hypothetical protein